MHDRAIGATIDPEPAPGVRFEEGRNGVDISLVDIELNVQRKGAVRAQIDLRNGLLKWREANRWNRDFTRSLNERECRDFQQVLVDCRVTSWRAFYPDEERFANDSSYQMGWALSLYGLDTEPLYYMQGRDAWPSEFPAFADAISVLLRQPFRVME